MRQRHVKIPVCCWQLLGPEEEPLNPWIEVLGRYRNMAGSEEEEGLLNLSTMAGIEASQVGKEMKTCC